MNGLTVVHIAQSITYQYNIKHVLQLHMYTHELELINV